MTDTNSYLDDVRALMARCEKLYDQIKAEDGSGAGALAALARGLFEAHQLLSTALGTAEMAPKDAVAPASAPPTEAAPAEPATPPVAPAGEGASEDGDDSGEPAIVRLGQSLSKVLEVVEAGTLVIDNADLRFAAKAPEIFGGMNEAQRGSEKAARLLVDCVRFMDVLEHEYVAPGYETLHATVAAIKAEFATHLADAFNITFTPDARTPGADAPAALAGLPGAKQVKFPSSQGPGTPLALLKRGLTVGGKSEPAEVLVSLGSTTPAFELIDKIAHAILRPMNVSRDVRQGRAAAFKEIRRKYLPQLVKADADHEATVIRYVANLLQPLNKEDCLGEMMRRLVAELSERGIKPMQVRVGGMFDDSFSTTKYERKMVPSDKAKGTIVSVLQIGFVNREGVPIQKAVLGVSGGPVL